MKTLILGANSDIAKAIAKQLKQDELILASRDKTTLNRFASENQLNAKVLPFDAMNVETHDVFVKEVGEVDRLICAFGYLGDPDGARADWAETDRIISTNFTGAVSILDRFANEMEKRKKGIIIGIGSVAGDRGRKANYHYGAAKAGFEAYLSGLRGRLFSSGIHVLTVKPGFIKTKMLGDLETPDSLTKSPEEAAKRILGAQKRNVIYVGRRWYFVMGIIKRIPEAMFKKMSI